MRTLLVVRAKKKKQRRAEGSGKGDAERMGRGGGLSRGWPDQPIGLAAGGLTNRWVGPPVA